MALDVEPFIVVAIFFPIRNLCSKTKQKTEADYVYLLPAYTAFSRMASSWKERAAMLGRAVTAGAVVR